MGPIYICSWAHSLRNLTSVRSRHFGKYKSLTDFIVRRCMKLPHAVVMQRFGHILVYPIWTEWLVIPCSIRCGYFSDVSLLREIVFRLLKIILGYIRQPFSYGKRVCLLLNISHLPTTLRFHFITDLMIEKTFLSSSFIILIFFYSLHKIKIIALYFRCLQKELGDAKTITFSRWPPAIRF